MTTCIDHCIRPPRLILLAALLSMMTLSLPSADSFSTDNTKVVPTAVAANKRIKLRTNFHNSNRRKLQSTTTTENSADDEIDSYKLLRKKGINATVSSTTNHFASTVTIPSSNNNNKNELCTPMDECELCPHKWKQLLEKDDEKIKGEFESCVKYGRRQQFECTLLFQEHETSEKVAQSRFEYKPCRFTESDEEFRMLQMQFICLIVGLFSVRNVRRHKMSSASLFDQRRMRGNTNQGGGGAANNGSGGGGSASSPSKHAKYSGYSRKDSLESVELGPLIKAATGVGKVPKSPAPLNMNAV